MYKVDDLINKIKSNGYKSFTEFAQDIIQTMSTGKEIDTWIPTYAINILKHKDESKFNEDFLNIQVNKIDDFIKLAKDSNGNFLDIGTGCFSAYNNTDNFPITRIYIYNFKSIQDFQYLSKQLDLSSFNKENIDKLINKETAYQRIHDYLEKTDDIFKNLVNFTQGRIDNTSLTGGVVIARQDKICAICSTDKSTEIEEIAYTSFESGLQVSFEVCKNCISESPEKNHILKFMFQDTKLLSLLNKRELHINDIREISNNIVKTNLNCCIQTNASQTNDTITAFTKCGYILKLRLTTLSSYGYMILNSDETELIRYDSANHHSEKIEFMPHHVHNDVIREEQIKKEAKSLSKKKGKEHKKSIDITDSFLTGFIGIDYISIKNKIHELENC